MTQFVRFLLSFFHSGAAVIVITAGGLSAAIWASMVLVQPAQVPGWVKPVCWAIGVLGLVAAVLQWRQGNTKLKQLDGVVEWASEKYASFPENWKSVLNDMYVKSVVPKGTMGNEEGYENFRRCQFVGYDGNTDYLFMLPHIQAIFPDIVKAAKKRQAALTKSEANK
jgi:hypothetical protein